MTAIAPAPSVAGPAATTVEPPSSAANAPATNPPATNPPPTNPPAYAPLPAPTNAPDSCTGSIVSLQPTSGQNSTDGAASPIDKNIVVPISVSGSCGMLGIGFDPFTADGQSRF